MIAFSSVSKQFGGQILFVEASFQINPGEKVGLVGPNGAGKSTVFRLIAGEESPDDGTIERPRKLTLGYFRQDVGDLRGRTILAETCSGAGEVAELGTELAELSAKVDYSLSGFVSRIRDAIIQAREVDGRAFFENAGKVRAKGIEAGLGLTPLPWVRLQAAYSYANYAFAEYRIRNGATTDTLDGKRLAGVPRHFLRASLAFTPGPIRLEIEQTTALDLPLHEVAIRAGVESRSAVLGAVERGHQHDRDLRQLRIRLHLFAEGEPIHPGHPHVTHEHLAGRLPQERERFFTIGSGDHLKAGDLQQVLHRGAGGQRVVRHQDPALLLHVAGARRAPGDADRRG